MGMSGCGGAGAPAPITTQVAGQSGTQGAPAPGKPIQGGGPTPDLGSALAPILAELTKIIQQLSTMVGGISGGGPGQAPGKDPGQDPTQAPGKILGGGASAAGTELATKIIADLDADKNGQVNGADVTQHATTGSQFAYLAAATLSIANRPSLDVAGIAQLTTAFRNADGTLDKASFQAGLLDRGQNLLARFDADRNGTLNAAESGALVNELPK